jgi:glycosyltransferase involved in cell wall biosynthesis
MDKTLWIGLGASAQAWYRCALPANNLDQDWAGYVNGPPTKGGAMISGNIYAEPKLEDYKNIIIQFARGEKWIKLVSELQDKNIKVYYECDDFIHGINRMADHKFKKAYNKKAVKEYIDVLKVCDGVICSTEFLANEYKKYNNNIKVCKVGIDTKRYNVEKPYKTKGNTIIGWSGGTGHLQAVKNWYPVILDCLSLNDDLHFVSAGANYADEIAKIYPKQAISCPWTTIENYPYVISAFDISIAPSHESKYFKSKSDLRWVEASAAGIPVIANPNTYIEVEDNVTGLLATDKYEFYEKLNILIDNPDKRKEISDNAKEYIIENRDISKSCNQWVEALEN